MDSVVFAQAAELAAPYFQPNIAATIRRFIAGNYGLAEAILHILSFEHLGHSFAEGMPHFCAMIRAIFAEEYQHGLMQRATAFDDFCRESSMAGDEDGISDAFIQEKPIICWIVEIVKVIASHSESTAEGRNATVHPGPVTTRAPCPIIQIDLQGTSPWQAWQRGGSWSPSSSRTLPVYHGTSNNLTSAQYHADYAILEAGRSSSSSFRGLEGHANLNQVVPSDRRLPIVWTGFSPLRCFIWAAWRADVIGDLRQSSRAMEHLSKRWEGGDHEHTGVILYEFRPFPAPGISQYIIPEGYEQAWDSRRLTIENERLSRQADSSNDLWALFSGFHGNNPSAWPEALHCKELGQQRSQLEPHVKQLWRTVWFGQGIETVNRSHCTSFAISVQPVQTTPAKQGPDSKGPNTKIGPHKFRKSLWKWIMCNGS
ncbi:hypothetical protein FDECE_6249 [Fusarium decemcellulare]|nr:hypothetical protein FDECE_6249 [Fusarium decemcellulare]